MAEHAVSKAQNGSTIRARVGDIILVRLAENPTTGFQWAVDSGAGRLLVATGDDFILARDSGIGAGGERVLRFRADSAGSTTLQLKLWRDWEGDASVTDRFRLTVEVAEAS